MKSIKIVLHFLPEADFDKWQWQLPDLGTDYLGGGDCPTHDQAVRQAVEAATAIYKREHQAHIDTARESQARLTALNATLDKMK